MLLKVRGLHCPYDYQIHEVAEIGESEPGIQERPEYCIPLGETEWPEDVKERVSRFYMRIGIEDPLKQKLVERTARAFMYDIDAPEKGVDWDMLVDYFDWEATAWEASQQEDEDNPAVKRSHALQRRAEKVYGGYFFHYMVYTEDGYY